MPGDGLYQTNHARHIQFERPTIDDRTAIAAFFRSRLFASSLFGVDQDEKAKRRLSVFGGAGFEGVGNPQVGLVAQHKRRMKLCRYVGGPGSGDPLADALKREAGAVPERPTAIAVSS